jgi:hypothetical protein
MLHEQEGHPGCGRELGQQLGDGFQASRGGSDSDYWEGFIRGFHQSSKDAYWSRVQDKQLPPLAATAYILSLSLLAKCRPLVT